jgi:hypothetical protein
VHHVRKANNSVPANPTSLNCDSHAELWHYGLLTCGLMTLRNYDMRNFDTEPIIVIPAASGVASNSGPFCKTLSLGPRTQISDVTTLVVVSDISTVEVSK